MITEKAWLGPCRIAERATAAPAYPPIKACDDDVGSAHHQVSKSQTIAPVRPARTTYWVTASRRTMPLPMVFATAVPKKNAARKLKAAAQKTAKRGESTRVDTTVAMLFAASWNPFRKSKIRAQSTLMTTRSPTCTGAGSSQIRV